MVRVVVVAILWMTFPNTVLLTADNAAKVGDFGLVKLLADENDVQHASKMVCSQACALMVSDLTTTLTTVAAHRCGTRAADAL